jgi:Tol biopolymer transport system component
MTIKRFRASWAFPPAGAAIAFVLLLGTVTLGVRLRAVPEGEGLPRADALESGRSGGFSPLSPSFITGVLGGIIGLPGRVPDLAPADGVPRAAPTSIPRRISVVHGLTNDDRSQAREVPSVPFTARTETGDATREPGESRACGIGGSVWYRFTAPYDVGLIANTFGSSYSTALGVFSGPQLSNVGCDTDVQGNAIVHFAARKGMTYFFQIAGPAGGGGLVFSLDPEGVIELASVSPSGAPANASAFSPSLSDDGRFVTFVSTATNLVPQNTGTDWQIFIRDRVTSTVALVSAASTGKAGNGNSRYPFVSGDGHYVVFESEATNLVPGDTNDAWDVFVRDVRSGRTERVSVSSEGEQARQELPTEWDDATADRLSYNPEGAGADTTLYPTLTPDGRFVAFQSKASNLVRGDHNHVMDVFVHDRVRRTTERVSVSSTGAERGPDTDVVRNSNEDSMVPSISGDGRFVSFRTSAPELVPGDDNQAHDIFVHDRKTHATRRISSADAQVHLGDDDQPRYAMNEIRPRRALSFDGRHVSFTASSRRSYGPMEANVFVHDTHTGRTVQANVSSTGAKAEDNSSTRAPSISSDGRYVAFHSLASNLAPNDNNRITDVFIRDLRTGTTRLLTVAPQVLEDGPICGSASVVCGSFVPSISADGYVVAFESGVFGGGGQESQVYVHERPASAA